MAFGWIQLEWFGDKLNCQRIKLLIMRPCARHRPSIVMLIKMGKLFFFVSGRLFIVNSHSVPFISVCSIFFFLVLPYEVGTLSIMLNSFFLIFFLFCSPPSRSHRADSSMIIPIFRLIMQKFQHSAKHRVNAAEHAHRHRMQRPHLLVIHV